MSLGRQAKTLSKGQIEAVVGYLNSTRYPLRNRIIFYLSIRAGLRAKEIAGLTWPMITDSSGQVGDFIRLEDRASKGRSGRSIPIHAVLKQELQQLHETKWLTDDEHRRRGGWFFAELAPARDVPDGAKNLTAALFVKAQDGWKSIWGNGTAFLLAEFPLHIGGL
jgi:integrase